MAEKIIKIQDTLSGKKQTFKARGSVVNIYGCGPTVYGYTHVGNARAFLTQDLVVRVFKRAGYKVCFARNYTDIDDKIIHRAQTENKTSEEVAVFFTKAFDQDLQALDILPADRTPRATLSIPAICEMISALEKKGFAYVTNDGVYYRVEKFAHYGCLSHRKIDDMLSGTRVDSNEHKDHAADFALWKMAKPGEPSWDSPWGKGRPGWHIECSAMIFDLFKDQLDIHMGGLDLIFPHHENEIAQSEALSESRLANYWIHNGMLEVGKEKMSKSLGNLTSISDFVSLYGAESLRVLFAQNHYRSPLEYSGEAILRAEALVDRLYICKRRAFENSSANGEATLPAELQNLVQRMEDALFDDFNSAKALGFALSAARACFREDKPEHWKSWGECLSILNDVLGVTKKDPAASLVESNARRLTRMNISPDEAKAIDEKLREREQLRAAKKFAEADQARKDLEAKGILVMDGPDGTTWSVG